PPPPTSRPLPYTTLFRSPGPLNAGMHVEYAERKHRRKPVVYPHASLQEILEPTHGIIVYQEQVMQIAVRMAGYSMGQADLLRKVDRKSTRLNSSHQIISY